MLPALQSLLAASDAEGREAAASLLSRMTPPSRVLPVLLQALQVSQAPLTSWIACKERSLLLAGVL